MTLTTATDETSVTVMSTTVLFRTTITRSIMLHPLICCFCFFWPTTGLFGDVHFDDEEQFTTNNKGRGVDLFWLALHELGHSLGLDHSSNKDAIMYPIYRGSRPGLQLHRDDIMGIQQLYSELKQIVFTLLYWNSPRWQWVKQPMKGCATPPGSTPSQYGFFYVP